MLTKMLTKSIPYTFICGGYFYFSRLVPTDLRHHYSYHRVVQGLHTSSPQKASSSVFCFQRRGIFEFLINFRTCLAITPRRLFHICLTNIVDFCFVCIWVYHELILKKKLGCLGDFGKVCDSSRPIRSVMVRLSAECKTKPVRRSHRFVTALDGPGLARWFVGSFLRRVSLSFSRRA